MMKALSFFLALQASLYAHPHVFIDAQVTVGKEKIGIVWKFDEMTSNVVMLDYDKNKNMILESNEIASLYRNHFSTLSEYSWFTRFYIDHKETPVAKTGDFTAFTEKKRLIYTFSVRKPTSKHYEIRLYDPDIYVAIDVAENALRCIKGVRCRLEDFDDDYGYGYKVSVDE